MRQEAARTEMKRCVVRAHQLRAQRKRHDACYTDRMNQNFIDDMAARIRGLMEQGPAADFDRNVRALLTGFFNRLDLVTREEYDVQREVLLRTREKLAALEAKVSELERKASGR